MRAPVAKQKRGVLRGISPSANLSAVMNDIWRAAGRTGIAAVLGSKKLKAIFVKGKNRLEVVDKESYFFHR